ncbi:hypothetical protein F7725_028578 [Dissostichus mawsoni]|uniref:Uncharacterized protein n=1 Tax=Dissostichus mawsoni TaxID=36200 RepID=A0A7J5XGD6_DISMA|nr:hypothetical protein F7725_028578 [Dissostichus mawsoni]
MVYSSLHTSTLHPADWLSSTCKLLWLAKETNAQGYHHLEEEGGTLRNGETFREVERDKFSTTDSAPERWRGGITSVDFRCALSCFLNYWSLFCSLQAHRMHRHRPARGFTLLLPVALWIFCHVNCVHGALPTTRKLFFLIVGCAPGAERDMNGKQTEPVSGALVEREGCACWQAAGIPTVERVSREPDAADSEEKHRDRMGTYCSQPNSEADCVVLTVCGGTESSSEASCSHSELNGVPLLTGFWCQCGETPVRGVRLRAH